MRERIKSESEGRARKEGEGRKKTIFKDVLDQGSKTVCGIRVAPGVTTLNSYLWYTVKVMCNAKLWSDENITTSSLKP